MSPCPAPLPRAERAAASGMPARHPQQAQLFPPAALTNRRSLYSYRVWGIISFIFFLKQTLNSNRYVSKPSNVFLTSSIYPFTSLPHSRFLKTAEDFTRRRFNNTGKVSRVTDFSPSPKTQTLGGKKEPITAGISLQGHTKRNTILHSLSAIAVPYSKEIKSSLDCKNEPIYSACLQVTLHHLLGQFAHAKGNDTKKPNLRHFKEICKKYQ